MKVKLTLEVEPELRRRIKVSAASRDESLREWILRAILRELEEDGEEEEYYPPEGRKPEGVREGAPKSRTGRTVAEAVIEDRR